MSNWQPGDLALCIKQGPWEAVYDDGEVEPSEGPAPGSINVVKGLVYTRGDLCLHLDGWLENDGSFSGFIASRFRKVTPGSEPEGAEVERRRRKVEPA